MPRLLCFAACLLAATTVEAATYTVTRFDDPAVDGCQVNGCSLREALQAASAYLDADTVQLQAGTYRVLLPAGATQVTLRAVGEVTIVGAGPAATSIRSYGPGSVFEAGGTITFRDLQIRNGSTLGSNTLDGVGAAIRATGSELILDSVSLAHNETNSGGALFASYSTVTITKSELHSNLAHDGAAGAHFSNSNATFIASRLHGNTGTGGGAIRSAQSSVTLRKGTIIENNEALQGGAIMADGELAADDTCELRDNIALLGGAVYGLGDLTLRGIPSANGTGLLRISGNVATTSGGGGIAAASDLRVERVELAANRAQRGAGINMQGVADLIVTDSRIVDNIAAEIGGAISTWGTGRLERTALQGNHADASGGAISLGAGSVMALENVDIYGNTAPSGAAISNSGALSMTHVTISGNRAGHAYDALRLGPDGTVAYANSILDGRCTGSIAGITALGRNLRTTSLLGSYCPGTTATAAQLGLRRATFGGRFEITGTSNPSSVLIDGGAGSLCLPDDIRAAQRDARCDIGAFEYGAVAP